MPDVFSLSMATCMFSTVSRTCWLTILRLIFASVFSTSLRTFVVGGKTFLVMRGLLEMIGRGEVLGKGGVGVFGATGIKNEVGGVVEIGNINELCRRPMPGGVVVGLGEVSN